jgi:hypothetical protein
MLYIWPVRGIGPGVIVVAKAITHFTTLANYKRHITSELKLKYDLKGELRIVWQGVTVSVSKYGSDFAAGHKCQDRLFYLCGSQMKDCWPVGYVGAGSSRQILTFMSVCEEAWSSERIGIQTLSCDVEVWLRKPWGNAITASTTEVT